MSFVSAPLGRYWRAVVYDTYTGRQWLSTAQDEVEFMAGDSVSLPAWEMRRPLTQTVTLMGPTGSVLFAAPDIARASVPMKATVRSFAAPEAGQPVAEEGAQAAGPFEISMARAQQTFEEGDAYTIVSANTTVTELALRGRPSIIRLPSWSSTCNCRRTSRLGGAADAWRSRRAKTRCMARRGRWSWHLRTLENMTRLKRRPWTATRWSISCMTFARATATITPRRWR